MIGKRGTSIHSDNALDYVFGYTIANDVVSRDAQFRASRFSLDTGLDGWCPFGPFVVDRASVPTRSALTLEIFVNGGLRQRESVGHMLFSLPTILSERSRGQTLDPATSSRPARLKAVAITSPRALSPPGGHVVPCRVRRNRSAHQPRYRRRAMRRVKWATRAARGCYTFHRRVDWRPMSVGELV